MPSVPIEHTDFGQAIPCQCQESDSDRQKRIAALERYSNLGELKRSTFSNANPHGPSGIPANRQAFGDALCRATQYADKPVGWITFAGPSGSGKTYLAAAIANRRIEASQPVLFTTVADLSDSLRGTFDDDAELGFIDFFEQVRSAPMLILDDLPTRPTTPWTQERLLQLISWRYSARLPTVITLRGEPNRLDEFLLTRLESSDGFAKLYRLGKIGGTAGRVIGTVPESMSKRMTFASFDPRGNGRLTPAQEDTLKWAKNQLDFWSVSDPFAWIYMHGPVGVGKTHLAVAAATEREKRGDDVFFATVPDLLDYLRATFAPDSPVDHNDLLDRIKTADLVVLDDMGAERSTPFAEDKLFQIVNYRYEERLPTIITAAQNFDELTKSRPRIASRLQDQSVAMELPMLAPDYRQENVRRQRSNQPNSTLVSETIHEHTEYE